jgi:hypothetical protein
VEKRRARILLSLTLLAGLAVCCVFVGVSLYSGIIDTNSLGETLLALIAAYSPNLAVLFGALQAGKHENGRASKNGFVLALSAIILWNILMIARVAWFASTGFSSQEDRLASVLEFWKIVGGTASVFVIAPIGFYFTKQEL